MSIKTGQFIKLYKIMYNHIREFVSFLFTGNRGVFGTQSNIYGGAFLRKKLTAKSC